MRDGRGAEWPSAKLSLVSPRIKKLKNGMKLQPLPDRPESMPTKPAKARRIYFLEKRHLDSKD